MFDILMGLAFEYDPLPSLLWLSSWAFGDRYCHLEEFISISFSGESHILIHPHISGISIYSHQTLLSECTRTFSGTQRVRHDIVKKDFDDLFDDLYRMANDVLQIRDYRSGTKDFKGRKTDVIHLSVELQNRLDFEAIEKRQTFLESKRIYDCSIHLHDRHNVAGPVVVLSI